MNTISTRDKLQIVNAQIAQWQANQYSLLIQMRVQKRIGEALGESSAAKMVEQIEGELQRVEIALEVLGGEMERVAGEADVATQ